MDKKKVKSTVNNQSDDYKKKIELMKKAAIDPLFLQDMKEIMEDFKYIDSENLDEDFENK